MNRLRLLVPLVIVVGIGCSEVAVPDGTLVICADDDHCPDGLVCEPTSRLCVRALVGDELAPPTATITPTLIGGPFISAGTEIVVGFTFTTPPLRAPTVALLAEGVDVGTFVVDGADTSWRAGSTSAKRRALPTVSAYSGRSKAR